MKKLLILSLLCIACGNPGTEATDTASTTTSGDTAAIAANDTTPAEALVPTEPPGGTVDTFSMPTNTQSTPSGLKYTIDLPGTGPQPKPGQIVAVHYTGWLPDGTKFDSSRDGGAPIEFPLGQGRVIDGWDEGIGLMKVGEKRTLVIPPDLAYGSRGSSGVIPPNATLVFKVELVSAR
ncbi:MAG TPA: FKBP-type peptidyl-prolyl cis-trans isomerase [Thermoanaerobaculia bacterium]|nr:FKBP-type peptidyl-prolyl cis-trans isomerase [Thermoanaerobaculia bacterium]